MSGSSGKERTWWTSLTMTRTLTDFILNAKKQYRRAWRWLAYPKPSTRTDAICIILIPIKSITSLQWCAKSWEYASFRLLLHKLKNVSNDTTERRLIPLMKLDDVQDMESTNKYLQQYPIAHTPLPQWANKCLIHGSPLKNNDCTVCYKGKFIKSSLCSNVLRLSKNVP